MSIWSDHPHWDEELRSVVAESPGATWMDITEKLGAAVNYIFTEDQVRNRAKRLGLIRPAVDTATEMVAAARLKAARLAENRELASAVKAQGKWEDFLDIVRGELLVPPSSGWTVPVPAKVGEGTPETMVVVLSDVHIGKLVRADHTGPGFGYDHDTFVARGNELLATILRLRDIQSTKGPIPKLVVYFLGDGVDGVDMRRGHGKRVDMDTATQQTMRLAQFFGWLLQELLPFFDTLELYWRYGNHGRVGDFGVNLPSDNWDYLAGKIVEMNNPNPDRVRIDVPTQKFGINQVGPLTVYSAHGDMIRGGGGSPVVKRHVANLQNLHRQQFDLVLMGHFHTSELFTAGAAKVFMNGAWDGGDDFSVNQLVMATDPAQWAFGIHPRRGVTWTYEMTLGGKRPSTPAD